MKIILLADEQKLGKKGDLLDVSDGYARNHLIPKGKAVMATPGAERQANQAQKTSELKLAKDLETAKEIQTRLEGTGASVRLGANASEEGKLYGSVAAADIAAALGEQHNITVDASNIAIDVPIKELGTHQVKISAHKEVSFSLAVEVVAA